MNSFIGETPNNHFGIRGMREQQIEPGDPLASSLSTNNSLDWLEEACFNFALENEPIVSVIHSSNAVELVDQRQLTQSDDNSGSNATVFRPFDGTTANCHIEQRLTEPTFPRL